MRVRAECDVDDRPTYSGWLRANAEADELPEHRTIADCD
jgi:hypothetical protein